MTTLALPTPTRSSADPTPPERGRLGRLLRGRPGDPGWARPALLALLVATAALYLVDLSASGYANSFYAAAVQAGSQSWKAWFFGSLDSANSITVDKPPASLWVMGLSARIFGFNSWSLLVPQALEGVAAVGLLYGAVRRVAGHGAGIAAGAILALTPAAVLMFRFDNPDAMLVLLLVAAAYAVTRALEAGRTAWLVAAGSLVGVAFLTKMLQAFLVLPAFALAYLICGPVPLRRRIAQLLASGLALIGSAGWYVLTVALWPAADRPYIGGSGDNSILGLAFGYNGLDRLSGGTGNGGGGGGSSATGTSFGGAASLRRLFSNEFGNEISWLLPAALVALVAGLWVTRRAVRTDTARAALLLWGGWLLVTGAVFSYMEGTVHPYYTVALAPAIAALVATGGRVLWQQRDTWAARIGLAATTLAAGGWSIVLLARIPSWHPEIRYAVGALTALAVVALVVPPARLARAAGLTLASAVLTGLLGTAAFAGATAASAHTGSIPTVGPAVAAASTGGIGAIGSGTPTGRSGGAPTGTRPSGTGSSGGPTGTRPTGAAPSGRASSGTALSGTASSGTASSGRASSGTASTGARSGGTGSTGSMPSGAGGGGSTSTALTAALKASTTIWAAAVVGDQSAATLELSSGKAIMSIGGWSGSDASPTLAQFEKDVAAGKIHYLIAGSGTGGGGGSSSGSAITTWVAAHYTATTIGGTTVYDLTATAK
jgi:4-amino-4-deoxy-L-arabinose transferase-like glycosyltransferase